MKPELPSPRVRPNFFRKERFCRVGAAERTIRMKITIIYGSPRKGATFHEAQIVKEQLSRVAPCEFTQFFLPRDMPVFCKGCYNCFFKGADQCPDAKYVRPILDSMLESDGIVITSPVYVLSESAAVKSLLDHLGWIFMVHRPEPAMFSKKAMILSATAGAGTGSCMKTIEKSLRYWGVNRIYRAGFPTHAVGWDDMKESRRQKIERKLRAAGARFAADCVSGRRHRPRFSQWFMFQVSKKLVQNEEGNALDRLYWEEQGWLGKKTPFKP